jgi:hypothetical protein
VLGSVGKAVAVAHRLQLEELAVGVADHDGRADVRVLEHAAPHSTSFAAVASMSATHAERG